MNVCPVKAIYRDDVEARVHVDHDICIGCRSCIAVCPFGAMNFNPAEKKVFKCDLCSGDPQCVRFCDMKAVDFVTPTKESLGKKRDAAFKISEAKKLGATIQYEG
jgi:Fe-S-cluster-containing hydrogenase component 2